MDVDRTSWGSTLVRNHDENKTYILVKLSESFSNAIQEYSAPRIKFHGSRGAIKFPNGKSYDFSLEQSDNPVECIRQTKHRWESVGKTTCCLHVKGKDDVYQRTRTKMEAAEQEKRKYCTKLLGSPDSATSASSTAATRIPPTSGSNNNNNINNNNGSNNIISTINNATNTNNTNTHTNHNTHTNATTNTNSSNISSSTNNYYTLSKYPDITDVKQMKRYKAEFDKDYQEYQKLHGYLHRIEEKFRRLKETLRQRVEGSPEYEAARDAIFNEYEKINGDSNFHNSRSKYKQVYKKLAHIREKIFQFKREQRDKLFNARKKRKCIDSNSREDLNHL